MSPRIQGLSNEGVDVISNSFAEGRRLQKVVWPVLFALKNNGQLTLVAVPIFLIALATATVFLRFYARRLKSSRPFTDDYMILLALVSLPHF
jgi:hypothetical protein